jgi:hypothetical protein
MDNTYLRLGLILDNDENGNGEILMGMNISINQYNTINRL